MYLILFIYFRLLLDEAESAVPASVWPRCVKWTSWGLKSPFWAKDGASNWRCNKCKCFLHIPHILQPGSADCQASVCKTSCMYHNQNKRGYFASLSRYPQPAWFSQSFPRPTRGRASSLMGLHEKWMPLAGVQVPGWWTCCRRVHAERFIQLFIHSLRFGTC